MIIVTNTEEQNELIGKEVKKLKYSMFLVTFLLGGVIGWGFAFDYGVKKGFNEAKEDCKNGVVRCLK